MDDSSSRPSPFRERLLPSLPVYLLTPLVGASVGLVVMPFSPTWAVVTAVATTVLTVVLLVLGAPVVEVAVPAGRPDLAELRAGRARIPVHLLGASEVLDRAELRRAMGTEADARAWTCHRPWVPTGLRVPVLDPRDPAPYWLLSTRRPAQLQAALGGASSGGGQAAHSEQIS